MRFIVFALVVLEGLMAHALGSDVIPVIDSSARIKEHLYGPNAAPVPGEEDMRKIIIQWESIPGALGYEVCHNCQFTDSETVPDSGTIEFVPLSNQRSGRPVFVKPGAPLGLNTFRVRVSLREGEWGAWSEHRNFNVHEPGEAIHDEL